MTKKEALLSYIKRYGSAADYRFAERVGGGTEEEEQKAVAALLTVKEMVDNEIKHRMINSLRRNGYEIRYRQDKSIRGIRSPSGSLGLINSFGGMSLVSYISRLSSEEGAVCTAELRDAISTYLISQNETI
jgi:hypothetical protein